MSRRTSCFTTVPVSVLVSEVTVLPLGSVKTDCESSEIRRRYLRVFIYHMGDMAGPRDKHSVVVFSLFCSLFVCFCRAVPFLFFFVQ